MNEVLDVSHIIQLAVAPVFLLAGIGALLNVVTHRLARVIDRARVLEAQLADQPDPNNLSRIKEELGALDKRMLYAQRAIWLFSTAALLICVVVATLFIGEFIAANIEALIAIMFITTMLAMIVGLILFLMEISVATRTLRVRAALFAK
ncbi:DUF2721 domain-containing protein [Hyphococcus lacteus]|uniref:DUF2721 domain-containing protein n=1 Tax=Hyphococcus lacteus TaxID=3143536 RepID=A0ABV3Z1G2_9PROT